jgi:hypothetical protein
MSNFRNDCRQQLLAAAGELFEAPSPAAHRSPRARRVRRGPLSVAIALAALVLAAAALAATGVIGFGAPVSASHPPGRERASKTTGIGIPVAGANGRPESVQPLAISVPDPGGGLPWGMRVVRTTRGLLCLQIGRLLDGRLGVLGQDGQFDDDGLFHELPATVLDPDTCFAPTVWTIMSEDGLPAAGALQRPASSCIPPWLKAGASGPRHCAADDERMIGFGVLGPHAVSVSYFADGRLHTVPTVGRLGAYLIVLRVPPKLQHNAPVLGGKGGLLGGFPIGAGLGEVISRLLFRYDGHLCQTGFDRRPHGPPQCTSHISSTGALLPKIQRGLHTSVALKDRKVPGGYALRIEFSAPVAVTNASTAYGIQVTRPSSSTCGRGGVWGQSIEQDVPRGQKLHFSEFVPQPLGCRGVVRGQVLYGGQPFGGFLGSRDLETIGRFSFALP